jgi:hypothetical protein
MTQLSARLLQCYLAGAVAQAATEDLRVNLFTYTGFPAIEIASSSRNTFRVKLTYRACYVEFSLSQSEATAAAKRFKSGAPYDPAIFDQVQTALASLDAKVAASQSGTLAPRLKSEQPFSAPRDR